MRLQCWCRLSTFQWLFCEGCSLRLMFLVFQVWAVNVANLRQGWIRATMIELKCFFVRGLRLVNQHQLFIRHLTATCDYLVSVSNNCYITAPCLQFPTPGLEQQSTDNELVRTWVFRVLIQVIRVQGQQQLRFQKFSANILETVLLGWRCMWCSAF